MYSVYIHSKTTNPLKVCGSVGVWTLSSVDGSPGGAAPPIVHCPGEEATHRQLRLHRTQPLLQQILLEKDCAAGCEAERFFG